MASTSNRNNVVHLRLGTRTSKLALWQSEHVMASLMARWSHVSGELVHTVTQGDKRLDRPLPEIGGKGLFTAELEEALRLHEIDLAVHSLKDLPVQNAPGLVLGAIIGREDTRDVLVARNGWNLATLPLGAVVGTSSLRRQAQLLAVRPDLTIRPIRGNVDTRLRKVHTGDYDATVMAHAGLNRLGLSGEITERFSWETMLPAPGQGALAVQCREDDAIVRELLAALNADDVALAIQAERLLLQQLGGGCSAPIGAAATIESGAIHLRGRVVALDGSVTYEAVATGETAAEVAETVAAALRKQGAGRLLARLHQPLAGKRVVVTRAADQADDLSSRLRKLGAVVVEIPAIQIVPMADQSPLQAALAHLDQYGWILFTSTNAVEVFVNEMKQQSVELPGTAYIAAVGPTTRQALELQGIVVAAQPARYLGTEIVAELGDIRGQRILLPRSAHGREELPRLLAEAGAIVDDIATYSTEPAPLSVDAFAELARGVDIVTFASGSAVRALYDSTRQVDGLSELFTHATRACIGPITAEALAELGYPADVVAVNHTAPGLVDELVHHFAQKFAQEV